MHRNVSFDDLSIANRFGLPQCYAVVYLDMHMSITLMNVKVSRPLSASKMSGDVQYTYMNGRGHAVSCIGELFGRWRGTTDVFRVRASGTYWPTSRWPATPVTALSLILPVNVQLSYLCWFTVRVSDLSVLESRLFPF